MIIELAHCMVPQSHFPQHLSFGEAAWGGGLQRFEGPTIVCGSPPQHTSPPAGMIPTPAPILSSPHAPLHSLVRSLPRSIPSSSSLLKALLWVGLQLCIVSCVRTGLVAGRGQQHVGVVQGRRDGRHPALMSAVIKTGREVSIRTIPRDTRIETRNGGSSSKRPRERDRSGKNKINLLSNFGGNKIQAKTPGEVEAAAAAADSPLEHTAEVERLGHLVISY